MVKNKKCSVLLGILLLVPSQGFCSEQPISSKTILERMWFSMPSAPTWAANFTNNVTSGFANLSDNTKYLLYAAMAAFLGYMGYKTIVSPLWESRNFELLMRGEMLEPNLQILDSDQNLHNIRYIIRKNMAFDDQGFITGHYPRAYKNVFRDKVCSVLNEFEDQLNTKEKWNAFLNQLFPSFDEVAIEGHVLGTKVALDFIDPNIAAYRMYRYIKETCPKEVIMEPLKELLIERHSDNEQILQLLDQ